jgi:hypothetical protein
MQTSVAPDFEFMLRGPGLFFRKVLNKYYLFLSIILFDRISGLSLKVKMRISNRSIL